LVIPLGDHNPTRIRPWVTWILLALNVGVFLFAQPWSEGQCAQQEFFLRWAAVPDELSDGEPLSPDEVAAVSGPCGLQTQPQKSVYLAVVYSMFLHAGWLHLLGNMLYLWIFGNNVEDRLGHVRFVAFYLGGGLAATAIFVVPNADSLSTLVGASGAVAGVLGAYLVMYPRASVTVSVPFLLFWITRLPAALVLGLWFLVQIQGLREPLLEGGGVAYLAHAGGFAFGAVGALLLGFRPQRPRRRRRSADDDWP
jgi:membrane associated rhomboid family serine protease